MNGFLDLALNASFLVQLVMVILVVLSVWSWTIIFVKHKFLQNELNKTIKFDKKFWSGIDLVNYYSQIKDKRKKSAIEDIFCIGLVKYLNLHDEKKCITPETISQTSLRAMQVGIGKEQEFLDSDLQTLATIASVSPYIGLLGTVWGIMNSFQSLRHTSQTSIALVAPGISEALVATALGLIAAIPAVIAYNKFNGDIYKIISRYANFSEQLTELLQVKHIPLEESENDSSK